jgi:hypothetical protein
MHPSSVNLEILLWLSFLGPISLVERFDFLNLIVAPHEDTCTVVDVFGHHLQHTPHLAVNSLPTSYKAKS